MLAPSTQRDEMGGAGGGMEGWLDGLPQVDSRGSQSPAHFTSLLNRFRPLYLFKHILHSSKFFSYFCAARVILHIASYVIIMV